VDGGGVRGDVPQKLRGLLDGNLPVEASLTLSVAPPLSYTRGASVTVHLALAYADAQALGDAFSAHVNGSALVTPKALVHGARRSLHPDRPAQRPGEIWHMRASHMRLNTALVDAACKTSRPPSVLFLFAARYTRVQFGALGRTWRSLSGLARRGVTGTSSSARSIGIRALDRPRRQSVRLVRKQIIEPAA